ncbi:MAG: hypothetical protein ABJA82_02150 [Myxococcales bacterium]
MIVIRKERDNPALPAAVRSAIHATDRDRPIITLQPPAQYVAASTMA